MSKKYFDPNTLYLNRSNNIFALRFSSSILETKLPISIEIYCNSVENLHFDSNIVDKNQSENYVLIMEVSRKYFDPNTLYLN